MSEFGDYGVDYVVDYDERGDQSLTSVDPMYPVLVPAFCVFPVHSSVESLVPRVQRL